jgi:hypothetical protein
MTDRTDVAVVGYITPDMPFYIGQRNKDSDKIYKFIAYYIDPDNANLSHYVVLQSAITYYANGGAGIPDHYQLHYFKYIKSQENHLQFTIQAYLDPDCTTPANGYKNYLVYISDTPNGTLKLDSSGTYFNFTDKEDNYSQYPNDTFSIHAGIQGTLQASTTTGASTVTVIIEYYTSGGSTLNDNSVYDGMPVGVGASSSSLSNPLTSFFPVNWYNRFGFPINNPVYHYCPSQSSGGSFYTNFCTTTQFNLGKGNTSLEDNRDANGALYYYPSISGGACGSAANFISFLGANVNNVTTYQPSDGQNICSYNGTQFQSILVPSNLNDGIVEACQNSAVVCNLDISNCQNASTTCKPFCNNDCCNQTTFNKCANSEDICNALYPPEKIPSYFYIIICVLVVFLLIIGAVAIYFWMHRSTEEQCINLLKNIRSKNK